VSTREKLIKARLGMLALAEELQNISLAGRNADQPEPLLREGSLRALRIRGTGATSTASSADAEPAGD
jgi:hypothetical protein